MMRGKILLVVAVLAVFFSAGCAKEKKITPKAPLVKTEIVGKTQNSGKISYSGTVHGRYETMMAFQVGGQILSREVEAGNRVSEGDVLMVINPKDISQKAQQGIAQLEAAKAQLALAKTNFERYKKLYDVDAIAAATLQQYETVYEAALASYQAAYASNIEAQNALSYTQLIAPFDGVIAEVKAEAGQVVAAGQAILQIVKDGEKEIEINIPENKLKEVAIGKEVKATFWALKNETVLARVREISPFADKYTRSYKVRAELINPPQDIQLGMTANIEMELEKFDDMGVLLPMSAIYQDKDKPEVWVVEDGKAVRRKIQVIEIVGNKANVTGLKNGDIVIVAGIHKLVDGLEVRVKTEDEKP